MIRRLRHSDIDFGKFMSCVQSSAQRNPYAQADFLDVMCAEQWDILVLSDYLAVMPVPVKKKFGVRFVARPIGVQQLGVFSTEDDEKLNMMFFKFLVANYLVIDYAFNERNKLEIPELVMFKNHVIEPQSYDIVKKNYHADRRRNVRILPGDKDRISFVKITETESVRDFYFRFSKGISAKDRNLCFRKFSNLAASGTVSFFAIEYDREIASLAIMLEDDAEACAVTLCHNPRFSKKNIPSILIDSLLRHYMSGKKFSFMGSNIPSVAAFNLRFGAAERQYGVYQNPKFGWISKLKSIHLMLKNNQKK